MSFIIALMPLALLLSCATSIPVRVLKPAGFDMSGIENLVILDFGAADSIIPGISLPDSRLDGILDAIVGTINLLSADTIAERAGARIRSGLMKELLASGLYRVIDALEKGSYSPPPYDSPIGEAYVSGTVDYSVSESEGTTTEKDSKGTELKIKTHTRSVSLSVEYQAVDARSGAFLGKNSMQAQAQDMAKGEDAKGKVMSVEDLVIRAANSIPARMRDDFIPRTEYLDLVFQPSGDDPKLKAAEALARKGSYIEARESYLRIFRSTGSFAAGYNAALLREALGDRSGAASEMSALAETGNYEAARREARRMRSTIEGEGKAAETGIKRR